MKKFTIIWQWMMILLISSLLLSAQAQKNASADRVPDKSQISEEQLKTLTETGFTTDQLLILEKQGINSELLKDKEYLIKVDELLGMTSKENNKQEENPGSPTDPVSVYTFDQANGTFATVTGGTVLGTTTSDDQYFVDPALPTGGTTKTGPGFPIGFNFDFNGYTFDVFGVNNNGWMGLGQSSLTPSIDMNSTSGYTPLSSVAVNTPEHLRSRIAAMARDIQAQDGAELRIETIGNQPDRILVVQWIGYKKYGTTGAGDNFNFQIRLYETSNVIELVYGAVTNNATSTTLQVGLGGSTSSDFYNRTTTTDWSATIAGVTNTDACTLSESVYPVNGLTFIFNPPPAGSPGSPFNPNPLNGAQFMPVSADLTWDFGSLTETYDLYFDIVNPPVTKVVDNESAGTTGLYDPPIDLSYSTSYFWKVIARNSSKLETVGPVWTFTTECGPISTFPWTESFETVTIPALPSCWFEENGDWVTTNNANSTYDADAYSGTQFLRESWNAANEYIWMPGFSLEAGIPYDFSFWWAGDNYAGWTGEVFYNTSPISVGATQLGTAFVEGSTTTTKIYEEATYTFAPADAGTYYFAIRVNCPTSTPWYLSFDDIRFEPSPSCPQPMTLGATYIAATSADLTWISFSGLSDIEFGLAGFTPTGIPTYTGVASPYSVSGLTAVTAYSFYVRDDCGGGDYSYWSGPYTFTTQPSCPQPFDLGAANVTMTSADLIWTSFTNLSDVEFGPGGFIPTGTPTYTGITSPYNVSGLNSASPYDFYVRDDCGSGDYSFWSGPYTLLTSPGSQTLPVWEDFENGFVYFNNAAGNGTDWTINNTYYHSGTQCAHNSYNNTQTNILHETGVLDLSAATVVWLDFWQIAKTEGNYDHCIVEISTDGGLNYTPLPLETYTGSGNYHVPTANAPFDICFDEDSYADWGTGSEIPDNTTWWQHETFDLSNYLTTNVRLRFRLHTDGSVLRYGWLVDEILIFEPAYGTLAGTVTNAATSNPIEGASVTVGYLSATSGVDGTYSLTGVLTGTWNATCSKEGYNPITVPVTILEDQTTTQNFSLTAPQIVVNPLIVDVVLEPNAQTDESVNISNPGNGPLDWDASLVLIGDGGKTPWDLQFSFDVTAASGAAGNAGAECDGEYYYTTRWASSLIHKYDLSGNLIEEFSIPGVTGLRDLAYDGTYFYGGATANTIFKMDFTNKVLIGTISSPQPVRSIAYDEGQNGLWVANWATDIVLIDMSGATLATLPASVHMLAGIYGTAYDSWTAGGPYLWIFDQGGGIGTPQMIYQANLGSLTMTGFTHDVTADLPPDADALAGGLFTIPNVYAGTVSLGGLQQGVPDRLFVYELAPYSTWLTITPTSGMLTAGTNEDMTLHFDATDLLPGVYQAEIHFGTSPNVGSPVVNVTMTVEGLIPATNLALSHSCTDVELTWDMPTGGNPDSWNIYKDGVLLGNSTDMEHTDAMVMPNVLLSYYVKAVYAGEESMPSSTETITVPVPGSLQPIGLSAVANTPNLNYVTLDWNEPNACLEPEGYNVYRDNVQINTALVTNLTYVDGPLTSGLYEYKLKAVYYFGESGFSTPAYALIPVGIEETNDDAFRIFPNPASTMVTIESTMEITGIKIFNNSGQLVMDEKVKVLSYQIDVSRFENGIYYISLQAGEDKKLRKITVN